MNHKKTDTDHSDMPVTYLFFPFTHVRGNDMDTILAVFPLFYFLSLNRDLKKRKTSQGLSEPEKIIPFVLSPQYLDFIEEKQKQYVTWAEVNKGNEHNLKLLLKDDPYFTSDSDVAVIKSHIKADKKGEPQPLSKDLSLKRDLLFLKMAQLHDEQSENIDLKLENIDKISDTIVSDLRGVESFEDQIKTAGRNVYTDSRNRMVTERISAWFNCMAGMKTDHQEETARLYITTDEDVFHYFVSNFKDMVNILDIDNLKVHENGCKNKESWQTEFNTYVTCLLKNEDQNINKLPEVYDDCSRSVQIKVCSFWGDELKNRLHIMKRQISVCLIKLN